MKKMVPHPSNYFQLTGPDHPRLGGDLVDGVSRGRVTHDFTIDHCKKFIELKSGACHRLSNGSKADLFQCGRKDTIAVKVQHY